MHWNNYDFIMLTFQGFQDRSNYILFSHIYLEIRALLPSQFSELSFYNLQICNFMMITGSIECTLLIL